ncbi:MAG: hypothetical protein ACRDYZ_12615 [Acidimicrobiales bacterium]
MDYLGLSNLMFSQLVVGTFVLDNQAGSLLLGVHRICGDHPPGELDRSEQRREGEGK